MAAMTAPKKNKRERGELYYIGVSRGFRAPSITSSACWLAGLLESFPGTRRTYKDITGILGLPSATIMRGIQKLKQHGLSKEGMSTYKFDDELKQNKGKWYCPLAIMTETFKIYDDDGNVIDERKLTYSMQDVYSYFYTKLSIEYKKSKGRLEFTNKEIADELQLDEGTVAKAIDILKHAKLIYFPKANKGVNGHKKSVVSLKKSWSWFRKEKAYRGQQNTSKKAPQPAELTREQFYAELQANAQIKADKAIRRAENNKKYKQLTDDILNLRAQWYRALGDDVKERELSDRMEVLNKQRTNVLNNIGLSEGQLKPEYYAKCKCCQDSGRKTDGTSCECFDKRKRGSPPRSAERTTKGIA